MRNHFTAYIEPGDDGWWVATSPEVPPAIGQGRSAEEAREDLESSIAFVLEWQRAEAAESATGRAIAALVSVG